MFAQVTSYLKRRKLRRLIKSKKVSVSFIKDVDLSHANFSRAELNGSKMKNANLKKTNFQYANLQGSMMNNANLTNANLSGTNLIYVNFSGADLRGANLSNAKLYKTNFEGSNLSYANLYNARLDPTTNFTNVNLTNAIFDEEKLMRCIIVGATIKPMTFLERVLYYAFGYKKQNLKTVVPMNVYPSTN
jgi:hypothetical protein